MNTNEHHEEWIVTQACPQVLLTSSRSNWFFGALCTTTNTCGWDGSSEKIKKKNYSIKSFDKTMLIRVIFGKKVDSCQQILTHSPIFFTTIWQILSNFKVIFLLHTTMSCRAQSLLSTYLFSKVSS